MFFSHFVSQYNEKVIGRTTTELLTDVLMDFCETKTLQGLIQADCSDIFRIIPEYNGQIVQIGLTNYENFFKKDLFVDGLRDANNSIVMIIDREVSVKNPIEVGEEVAFGKIAEMNCPKVYSSGYQYF